MSEDEEDVGLIREIQRTSNSPKNPRLEHFKDIMRKNQGRGKLSLEDLNRWQSEILAQIPREELTKKKVRDFIQAAKLGWKANANAHAIFNHITGEDGSEWEHLEKFIIDDFKHFSLAFDDLHLGRKKFLNVNGVLFALLKKNGFPAKEEDFKLLTVPSKRQEQEKIISIVFEKLGWERTK